MVVKTNFKKTLTEVVEFHINNNPNTNYAFIAPRYFGKTTAYQACNKKYPDIFFMDDPSDITMINDVVTQHSTIVIIATSWGVEYVQKLRENNFVIVSCFQLMTQ